MAASNAFPPFPLRLYRGTTLLGTLEDTDESDFPWHVHRLIPTSAFEEMREVFERLNSVYCREEPVEGDVELLERLWSEISAPGVFVDGGLADGRMEPLILLLEGDRLSWRA